MEISSRHDDLKSFLKRFSYDDLKSFTNDFDTNIGAGGFGKVYRGEFPNGMQIAVKLLNELYVDEDLFMNEVRIMGMTYHHRLVRFLGYCSDSNKKGLVFEYMENGSLDKILRMKDRPVEWNKLYDIMIKTAKGISYLHDKRIIHHDIKPANILLDSEFSPKVADFGLAKLMNKDVTHVTASYGTGTRGYVAPEMAVLPFSHVTHKCDVYSFGMMLFDVLGMSSLNQNDKWFLEIVWEGYQNGQLDKIIKDCGIEEKDKKRANILSKVALWCTQYTPRTRPPMSVLVKILKGELQVMTPPNPFLPSSEIVDKILTQPENEENKMQPLTEAYEDKVSDKEIEDKILTQPENEDNKMQPLTEAYEDKVSDKELEDKILTQPENEDLKFIELQRATPVINSGAESSDSLTKYDFSLYDERDDVKIVIEYLMGDHGFSSGIPVAAILMYKCILKWRSQYLPYNPIDMLAQSIRSALDPFHKDHAPYWLSNTSMLLFLLERSFKVKITNTSNSTLLDQSAPNIVRQVQEVEANHPAFLFKQQLTTYVEKAYDIVRKHLKDYLRMDLEASWKADWESIIDTLDNFLKKLQDNFVPPVLTSKIFTQAFYYINVQLFNGIFTNIQRCVEYGQHVKAGLYELDHWCDLAKNYVGSSWAQLKHIRQAIELLVIVDKSELSLDVLTKSVCPDLSIPQLNGMCSMLAHKVPISLDLVNKLRMLLEADWKNKVRSPLILREGSSPITFSVDDTFGDMEKRDFSNIRLNVEIPRHPRFEFLKL